MLMTWVTNPAAASAGSPLAWHLRLASALPTRASLPAGGPRAPPSRRPGCRAARRTEGAVDDERRDARQEHVESQAPVQWGQAGGIYVLQRGSGRRQAGAPRRARACKSACTGSASGGGSRQQAAQWPCLNPTYTSAGVMYPSSSRSQKAMCCNIKPGVGSGWGAADGRAVCRMGGAPVQQEVEWAPLPAKLSAAPREVPVRIWQFWDSQHGGRVALKVASAT